MVYHYCTVLEKTRKIPRGAVIFIDELNSDELNMTLGGKKCLCGNTLSGRQEKYCSHSCRDKGNVSRLCAAHKRKHQAVTLSPGSEKQAGD